MTTEELIYLDPLVVGGVTVNVQNCARCGEDHAITFHPLVNPSDEWREWGTCQKTGQPVLLRRLVTEGEDS